MRFAFRGVLWGVLALGCDAAPSAPPNMKFNWGPAATMGGPGGANHGPGGASSGHGEASGDSRGDLSGRTPEGGRTSSDCGAAPIPLGAVQGEGGTSPLRGQQVEVVGRVTLDATAELRGFFVEALEFEPDRRSSEGLFVFAPDFEAPQIGSVVALVGTPLEYYGQTELQLASLELCADEDVPQPRAPELDWRALERFEGMRVKTPPLTVTLVNPSQNDGAFGVAPDEPEGAAWPDLLLASPDIWPTDLSHVRPPRPGDVLQPFEAVVAYRYGAFQLIPTADTELTIVTRNPRLAAPTARPGHLRVAFFNVRNWFQTLEKRGATTEAERHRQLAKLVETIVQLDPDVLGLAEIERASNGEQAALDNLVRALNAAAPERFWSRVPDPGELGSDEIRVALLYAKGSVEAQGLRMSAQDSVFARAPLAEAFDVGGRVFSVIASHFKSRGGCPEPPDEDVDQGFGCFDVRRTREATALLEFVGQVQEATGSDDLLVLGDLNANLGEPPLDILEAALQSELRVLPLAERYSYSYDGQVGLFDHILTSGQLVFGERGVWHINADESSALDSRNTLNYAPDAFRSSDHDPVWIDLKL